MAREIEKLLRADLEWHLESAPKFAGPPANFRHVNSQHMGFVHPKQITALNEVFTPSESQIARARRIISEFEAADTGLVVIDGKLIEKPVLREMYSIVAIAGRIET